MTDMESIVQLEPDTSSVTLVTDDLTGTMVCRLLFDVSGKDMVGSKWLPGSPAVLPKKLQLSIRYDGESWSDVSAVAYGPRKHKNRDSFTVAFYDVPFTDVLGEDTDAPDWVVEKAQAWSDRLDGDEEI